MDLKTYELNGLTYQFTPQDAERVGATPVVAKAAPVPQNKARDAASKGGRRGTPPASHRG